MAFACAVAVVGSGWAGTYAAWRLQEAGHSVCLFEAYHRPGGRTYSTELDGFTVDAGAYRFAGDMHLPSDLIDALHLQSECYDPTCQDEDVRGEVQWPYRQPLKKIVGFDGRHRGYGAALSAMLGRFEGLGGRMFLGAELVGIEQHRRHGDWLLEFNSTGAVPLPATRWRGRRALLNLPRSRLAALKLAERLPERWPAMQCTDRALPSNITEGATTTKVYALYEDAWWVRMLNLLRGVRENLTQLPVAIHYHDGEVLCSSGLDAGGQPLWRPARHTSQRDRCRGVLQVFYRHSQSCPVAFPHCMDFWAALPRRNLSDPLTVSEEAALRRAVHEKLIAIHYDQLKVHFSEEEIRAIEEPTSVAYSVWYHQGTFPAGDRGLLSGPQDVIFDQDGPKCGSIQEYEDKVYGVGAFRDSGLHVANNDFAIIERSSWHGPWAEQPLVAAEKILAEAFDLPRPAWLNKTYYDRFIARSLAASFV